VSKSAGARRRPTPAWLIPVAVLALAAVLVVVVVMAGGSRDRAAADPGVSPQVPGAPEEVQGPAQPDFTEAERRDDADLLAAGPVDAPVALVVFSDYQCPFCARWSDETLPVLMEHVEAGELRIEWRDANVFGPASERGARASYAAALQGSFWEYHDALFADGHHRPEPELSDEALVALAADLGLDTERFATDLASDQTAEVITGNAQLAHDLGVYSTPAFILGGQPIVGAQPTQVFVDAFQTALNVAE
jgi:protein-disulfide isomerase